MILLYIFKYIQEKIKILINNKKISKNTYNNTHNTYNNKNNILITIYEDYELV